MTTKARKGFTLIEILIVVAIIAILASVVLVGLGPTQQSGRDARRLSDLHEVQNGLELYYNKCGFYPGTSPCAGGSTSGYAQMATALTGAGLSITQIPEDPNNSGTHVYYYRTDAGPATTYVLGADLENANNTVFTSYTAPGLGAYTTGDAGLTTCASPYYCITL